VPTKVDIVEKSVQGKLGQQVTVKAQVTVVEGQSKAGVPVTFFIPGSNNGVKTPVTVEAVTNDEGIASYTYTRYAATNDTVTVYANGDRSKFSTGYVFWGVDRILSIEEVTAGSSINNGANKTYKVTYKHPETGRAVSGKVLNVSVKENIDVTVDKLQNVTVNGLAVVQTSANNMRAAQITTDSKGEATFTVSGSNAEVTPVVFEATPITTTNPNGTVITTGHTQKYTADTLQASAAKVTFGAIQAAYTLEITRDGGEIAATGVTNGRKYNLVVKDKDGKAAANETVNIAFNEDIDGVISTVTSAQFVKIENGRQVGYNGKKITVKTNAKGEASFVIGSDAVNSYATPIAWIDINNQSGKDANLDKGEPSAVAPISYFQAPYLDGSKLVSYKGSVQTDKFAGGEVATFKVQLTNQSGKVMPNSGYTTHNVTYTVYNTGANNVKVDNVEIAPNRVHTVVAPSGEINVTTVEGKTSSVKVLATGVAKEINGNKEFAFTAKEATATFTSTSDIANLFTGNIHSFNTDRETIIFTDGTVLKNAVKYAGESDKTYVYRNVNGTPLSKEQFVELLKKAENSVTVTYEVKDNTVTFYVVSVNASGTKPIDISGGNALNEAAVTTAKGKVTLVPALTTVAITDAAETKLAAVKSQVTKEINDSSVNVTVVETSTTGTYTVTLSKGSSTATVTVTPKFGQKLTATYITSSIAVNGNNLDLTIMSTLAGFTIANVNPDFEDALDITTGFNDKVITISKTSGGTMGADGTNTTEQPAEIKNRTLKIHFEAHATDYIKEKFTATITIDDKGNRTTKIEVATP